MPPITDIAFDEADAARVAPTSSSDPAQLADGGPVVPIQIGTAGQAGVVEISPTTLTPVVPGFTLTISADVQDYNVYDEFVLAYGAPPVDVNLTVNVEPGVIVSQSRSPALFPPPQPGMKWDNRWTGTPVFTLENAGYILGHGGEGGQGGDSTNALLPTDGIDGGNAMELSGQTVNIDNTGFIWGGGGGGGGGATMESNTVEGDAIAVGGGGSGGAGNAVGDIARPPSEDPGNWAGGIISDGQNGNSQSGSLTTQAALFGGFGADMQNVISGMTLQGGDGGTSGGYGIAGSGGNIGGGIGSSPTVVAPAGLGGSAGKAIDLGGGTANFLQGNNPVQVKGAVS